MDEFLRQFNADELRIASDFLSNWVSFLSAGLCKTCSQTLNDRIRSLLDSENFTVSNPRTLDPLHCTKDHGNSSTHSYESRKGVDDNDNEDAYSLGSWKDEAETPSELALEESSTSLVTSAIPTASKQVKKSWADMTHEDELTEDDVNGPVCNSVDADDFSWDGTLTDEEKQKMELSRNHEQYSRFSRVTRKKDFICFERVEGKFANILDGMELHKGVFSAAEQMQIINCVDHILEMGRKGRLKEHTYSEPRTRTKGKGLANLQFGCCYSYAKDTNGNAPGILRNETVDPLPPLFKVMIKRLVRWHVIPPTCIPDCCVVNIYEEGDCIPPHIDNHDFLRPFCTVSFLSECEMIFGTNLKVGAGEFTSSFSVTLPVGSVLVLNGNAANVAKHYVPAVLTKRISITFRKMDKSKWPIGFVPEPDLLELHPLFDEGDRSVKYNSSRSRSFLRSSTVGKEGYRGRGSNSGHGDVHLPGRGRQGSIDRRKSNRSG